MFSFRGIPYRRFYVYNLSITACRPVPQALVSPITSANAAGRSQLPLSRFLRSVYTQNPRSRPGNRLYGACTPNIRIFPYPQYFHFQRWQSQQSTGGAGGSSNCQSGPSSG